MASSPAAGPWDHCSHGEVDGGFAELLRQLMQHLSFTHPPLFRGRMKKIMAHESWDMEVFLYARTGEFVAHTYHAEAPRRSSLDAIQDAARVAITRLCWIHEDLLRESPFCFFPCLPDGERFPEIFNARDNNPCLTHQVRLTQAMILNIHSHTDEIRQLRKLLISSDAHSDTLRVNMIRSDEAHHAALWERDTVTAERDAALAEVARLTAALASATSTPVPPPAVPSSSRMLDRPLRPRGARTRMMTRKSVRRPSPPPFDGLPVSSRGCGLNLSGSCSRSPSFSQSRSRSRSPVE